MVGFSGADYATIIAAFVIASIPAYLGPRLTRIGLLQRREILQSLERLNPTIKSFRAELKVVSSSVRIWFLVGFAAALFGPIVLWDLGPVSFYGHTFNLSTAFTSPSALFLFFFSIATRSVGFRAARQKPEGRGESEEKTTKITASSNPLAVYERIFILQLAVLVGFALSFLAKPAGFFETNNWYFVGQSVAFAVFYAFQDLDLAIGAEDTLFRSYLQKTKSTIQVLVYVGAMGEPSSEPVRGRLTGIGKKLRIDRDDGYVEEIGWASLNRAATKS